MKPFSTICLLLYSLSTCFGQGNLHFSYTLTTSGTTSIIKVYVDNPGPSPENITSYTMNVYYDDTESLLTNYDVSPSNALGWTSLPSSTILNERINPAIPIAHTGFGNINVLDFLRQGTFVGQTPIHLLTITADNSLGSDPTGEFYLSSSFEGHMEQVYNDKKGPIPNAFPVIVERNTSLPVEWLLFEAEALEGYQSLLTWATVSESNNEGFEVQRSIVKGGIPDWEYIGFVPGEGTVSHPSEYRFVDSIPLIGKNTYRLRQIDMNGEETYSEVREVHFSSDKSVLVHPNPTADILNIRVIDALEDARVSYQLFDMKGKILQRGPLESQNVNRIDIGRLPEATYLLWIFHNGESTKERIIKKG
ncbi:MAG: T9SS type A sorting domain-containing protein [Bacteroidota bacterium]